MRLFDHIDRWNQWRKFHDGSRWYKLSVLLCLASPPPSFYFTLSRAERKRLEKSLERLREASRKASVQMDQAVKAMKDFSVAVNSDVGASAEKSGLGTCTDA